MLINASGIYQIRNVVTNKLYIGSATSIRQRVYWHIRNLNNNKHHSILLQRSWNKHGHYSFEFKVLEECSIDLLEQREQFYLDWFECYKPDKGYNIYNIVGSPRGRKLTEEHKLKISKGGKGLKKSKETKAKQKIYSLNRSKEHIENRNKALALAAVKRIEESNSKTHCFNGHELTDNNVWYRKHKHGLVKSCKKCRKGNTPRPASS
jgi:group I intron endonuclease